MESLENLKELGELNTAIHTLFAERQKALLLRTIYFIRCSDLFGNANMNPPVRLQLVRVKVERKIFFATESY